MASTTFMVRGYKVRTQSHFRYQLVYIGGNLARIFGRTDSLESAHKRGAEFHARHKDVVVIVDRTTGEEIASYPQAAKLETTKLEEQIEEEEAEHEEQQVQEFVEPEDTTGLTIDTAALFLTELNYPNMFELRGTTDGRRLDPYCKVCGEIVERSRQEAHHAGHKRDRANHVSEQIRSRKEQSDMAKAKTVTPKEQGFPAVYLNEDGSKFIPGGDAQAKSDLVKTVLHGEHGYTDIDLSARRAEISLDQAKKLLAARGWNEWVLKALRSRESKAAKDKATSEAKAAKVKDEVAAKRNAKAAAESNDDVKPDPKPEPKARARRSRKVGS